MSVYQRKLSRGTRFWITGSYLGQRYHSKCIYLTKTEARQAERARIKEIDEKQRNPNLVSLTMKPLIEERLDELKAKRSKQYYKDSRRYFKALLAYAGDVVITKITKKTINDLYAQEAQRLKTKKKTNHKLREMQRSIHALFEWALKVYDLEIRNPAHGLELYPIEKTLKYIPTEAEITKVYDKLDLEEKLLFDFVRATACRINEAIRFFNNPEIKGDQIVLWTRKAKNSTLTPRFINNPKIKTVKGRWTDRPRFLEDETEGKWNWHSLRHLWATKAANAGMPTIQIMAQLGHSQISTTMGYLRSLGIERL